MKDETLQQKHKRIFEHYYERIIKEKYYPDRPIRYSVIEYMCYFPKINPVYMARRLANSGYEIAFDDTSITQSENNKKRMEVFELDYRKRVGLGTTIPMFLEEPTSKPEKNNIEDNKNSTITKSLMQTDINAFIETFSAYYNDLDSLCKRLQDEYNDDIKFESDVQDRVALGGILDAFDLIREKLEMQQNKDNDYKNLSTSDIETLKKWGHSEDEFHQIDFAITHTDYCVVDAETQSESKISYKKARELLGNEQFLSGIARSAFHWTAAREYEPSSSIIFDSSKMFKDIENEVPTEKNIDDDYEREDY